MSGTAHDYLRFIESIRQGGEPILSQTSAELLTSHQIGELRAVSEGPNWGHGLGAAVVVDPEAAGCPQSVGTWQWGGVLGMVLGPGREPDGSGDDEHLRGRRHRRVPGRDPRCGLWRCDAVDQLRE